MSKQTYKEFLAKLAAKKNTTPEALEEKYGDMIFDMYELGDSVKQASDGCDADDAEYKEAA